MAEADPTKKGGVFKLFLGYAPGVGKTFSMLSEAIRRHSRGEDVVIGVIETHGRKATAELAAQLKRSHERNWSTRERFSRKWTLMPSGRESPLSPWLTS